MNTMVARTLAFLFISCALSCALAACGDDDGGDTGPATCGNQLLDVGEACDVVGGVPMFTTGMATCGEATGGQMSGGVLGCNTNCSLNVTMCTAGAMAASGGTGG